jgi:GxxExxY protein
MITKKYLNELSYEIIGSAIEVHKNLGRGFLESVYQSCMIEELNQRKISFLTEMKVTVYYKEKLLELEFRCDLFVEKSIVVELKATNEMHNIFDAQLLNYMNLLKCPKGILLNFNCNNIFKEGQKTFVNQYFKNLAEE